MTYAVPIYAPSIVQKAADGRVLFAHPLQAVTLPVHFARRLERSGLSPHLREAHTMTPLDLTEEMAAQAIAYDHWRTIMEANLIVKRDRRPARRAAALKGIQNKKGMA